MPKTKASTVMADMADTRSPFLECPREVRDMIYDLVLVGDSEIVPYPAKWEHVAAAKPHPSPALLVVSKQLAREARPVLYGKNQWRLGGEPGVRLSIFSRHPLLFRDITIFFDGRDLSDDTRIDMAIMAHSLPDSHYRPAELIEAAKSRYVHRIFLAQVSAGWRIYFS